MPEYSFGGESKEYVDKIEVVDEKSIPLLTQKITLRIKLRLKSRLKTTKGQKFVEDFTEDAQPELIAQLGLFFIPARISW